MVAALQSSGAGARPRLDVDGRDAIVVGLGRHGSTPPEFGGGDEAPTPCCEAPLPYRLLPKPVNPLEEQLIEEFDLRTICVIRDAVAHPRPDLRR